MRAEGGKAHAEEKPKSKEHEKSGKSADECYVANYVALASLFQRINAHLVAVVALPAVMAL